MKPGSSWDTNRRTTFTPHSIEEAVRTFRERTFLGPALFLCCHSRGEPALTKVGVGIQSVVESSLERRQMKPLLLDSCFHRNDGKVGLLNAHTTWRNVSFVTSRVDKAQQVASQPGFRLHEPCNVRVRTARNRFLRLVLLDDAHSPFGRESAGPREDDVLEEGR